MSGSASRTTRLRDPLEEAASTRRGFLLAGFGLVLAGCAQPQRAVVDLPAPAWDMQPVPGPVRTGTGLEPVEPAPAPNVPTLGGYIPRTRWARGRPVPTLMNRMRPIRYVTVHHDGMTPFYGDGRQAAARLEAIRRGHRGSQWGDIGYHFAVDRAGNVWECRPLAWQGAHVKDHNEGNVGVVALGNFDAQTPTEAQLAALERHVSLIMRTFKVPPSRLRTHQEWAPTRCPGRSLQRSMVAGRSSGRFG